MHSTGACGIAVTRGRPGGRAGSLVRGNAVARSGANPKYDPDDYYCYQRAVAVHAHTPDVLIAENPCFENREPGDAPGAGDLPAEEFRRAIGPLLERLERRPRTRASEFCREFGAPPPPPTTPGTSPPPGG